MFRLFLYPLTISRKNLLSVVFDFPKKVWTFYGSFSLSSKLKVDVSSVYPQVEKINPLRGLLIKMFNHVLIHWNRGRGGKHVGADERRDDKGSILLELIHYHFQTMHKVGRWKTYKYEIKYIYNTFLFTFDCQMNSRYGTTNKIASNCDAESWSVLFSE